MSHITSSILVATGFFLVAASGAAQTPLAAPETAPPEETPPPVEPSLRETRAPVTVTPIRAPSPEASYEPKLIPMAPVEDPERDSAADIETDRPRRPVAKRVLHGFRIGYLHVMNYDRPVPSEDEECSGGDCFQSLKQRYELRSPNQFLIGYEVMGRMVGHDWLNVLIVGNVMVSGIEQSKFLPSGNFLIGFEFDEAFQVGVGPSFTPEREKPAHMILAAGWTPAVGSFHVPLHAFFIPDVDANHKLGMTVGVNF